MKAILTKVAVVVIAIYATWIGMMCVHELGHITGALLTGGRVISVSVPLFGFSQTIIHPNPRELAVVWCGPIFGAAFPLLTLLTALATRRRSPDSLKFFAGFCAIANGAYIGLGWLRHAGDAGDMMRLGTPRWIMISFGGISFIVGVLCWHRTAALSLKTAA